MVKNTETTVPQSTEPIDDIINNMALAFMRFPAALFGKDDMFVATAGEDYLRSYGIHKDDVLMFRRQDRADYGQIVCALIGEELFIRLYDFDADLGLPYLKSANPDVPDAYEFTILGTVAWVMRRFDTCREEVPAS